MRHYFFPPFALSRHFVLYIKPRNKVVTGFIPISAKLFYKHTQVALVPYGVGLKDEHRTSNVQRRTSNNDVAALRNLISFVYFFCFFLPFDSAQGREPVENPEFVNNPEPGRRVEVAKRPF